jgi:hypothetical protein
MWPRFGASFGRSGGEPAGQPLNISSRAAVWGITSVGGQMATELENRSLGPRHRRLLTVLAKAPRGRDVNALLSRGFRFETIADLIRGGLATVQLRSMGKRQPNITVACVRITDAGRRASESVGESA